ncbi:MAG: helix-turn-helix domain-containing protein [Thermoleophilaceae bacterium]
MATAQDTYGDACGIPRALDRVGERWALMIVRELMLGPKRFTDLRTGLPHASPNVLSQRLRELEEAGVVRRRTLPPPAGSKVYELTEWGRELEPVLEALGRWGARAPLRAARRGHEPRRAHPLAARRCSTPAWPRASQTSSSCGSATSASAPRWPTAGLEIERGEATAPDASVETDHGTLLALAHRRLEPQGRAARGRRRDRGRQGRPSKRFLGLFTMPEPFARPRPSLRAQLPRWRPPQ